MNLPTSIKRSIDVSSELENYPLEPCNNIDVLLIPTGVTAFVSFKRDAPIAHMYPLYTNATCELKSLKGFVNAETIYLHTIGTSNTSLELNLSVIDTRQSSFIINKNADKLDITDLIMERFEKAINPYNEPEILSGSYSDTSQAELLNITLNCDKVKINISLFPFATSSGGNWDSAAIIVEFNNAPLLLETKNGGNWTNDNTFAEIENCRGKNLRIFGSVKEKNTDKIGFTIQKYTKKS